MVAKLTADTSEFESGMARSRGELDSLSAGSTQPDTRLGDEAPKLSDDSCDLVEHVTEDHEWNV